MRRQCILLVCCFVPLTAVSAQDNKLAKARIDPAGITGHVLVGNPDAVAARFVALAANGPIVIFTPRASPLGDLPAKLRELADEEGRVIRVRTLSEWVLNVKGWSAGIWLDGEPKDWGGTQDRYAVQAYVEVGGVVALAGKLAPLAASDALDLVPDSHNFTSKTTPAPPGRIGYELDRTAGLWFDRRQVRALGEGSIAIVLAKSPALEPRRIELTKRLPEDLTALRRAAVARNSAAFPPAQAAAPNVPSGTLFIVGGGGMPPDLFARFVEAAGGKGKANIVVLPTAQDPVVNRESLLNTLRKAGADKATSLPGRTLKEVDGPDSLAALREATGVWFDGGRQWRFVDAYEGTKALDLMWDVLRRGGAIGGSSAGATIQGDYLCRGSPFGNVDIRYEGYERGLAFLPGVAIDQHFSQRKRANDMMALMKVYPQLLGIGIDEATALVVKGHVGAVQGRGKVFFFDARRDDGADRAEPQAVADGGRYDLKARRALEP